MSNNLPWFIVVHVKASSETRSLCLVLKSQAEVVLLLNQNWQDLRFPGNWPHHQQFPRQTPHYVACRYDSKTITFCSYHFNFWQRQLYHCCSCVWGLTGKLKMFFPGFQFYLWGGQKASFPLCPHHPFCRYPVWRDDEKLLQKLWRPHL